MQFTLNAHMELQSVNARKEGPNDDKHVAVDLKFCGAVSIEDLLPLVGSEHASVLESALWDDESGHLDVRFPNITSIKPDSATEFDGLNCYIFGSKITEAKAHKFSFKPRAGGADLTFTLSLPDPSQEVLPIAANYLGEDVRVEVETAE